MIRIAHRGNLTGANPVTENFPDQIDMCIREGYDAEIDLWLGDGDELYLGHDEPQYRISHKYLMDRHLNLWIHCKEISVLEYMTCWNGPFNFFWHQSDDFTLTSLGNIWTFPGKKLGSNSVAVCPDRVPDWEIPENVFAVCSDNISTFEL